MRVNVFRRSDYRMVAENKYFSDRAAADRFCKFIAPLIWGKDNYWFVVNK